jgi:hypothetical protein
MENLVFLAGFFRTLLQFQVESYILEEICFLISAYSGDRRFFDALYGVVEADYPHRAKALSFALN